MKQILVEAHGGPEQLRLHDGLSQAPGRSQVDALGLKLAQGVVVAESFYWDLNDATRAWNKRFQERVGAPANMLQAAVYSSVFHYLKAVRSARTQDGRLVAATMKAVPIEDFYSDKVLL